MFDDAAVPALERPLGDLPPADRAGPRSPDPRPYEADEAGEPHPQAREEGAEHQGAAQGVSAAQSTVAPRMLVRATASRPRLDYAGQGEQDGRQNQTQAHGDSLGNLVRLEFQLLCRDRHAAGVHPSRGRVEHFWI